MRDDLESGADSGFLTCEPFPGCRSERFFPADPVASGTTPSVRHYDVFQRGRSKNSTTPRAHRELPVVSAYGITYGMEKTTLYLPSELRKALKQAALEAGSSEAEIIRQALAEYTSKLNPSPRLPLIRSDEPDLAERVDELLEGFGRR